MKTNKFFSMRFAPVWVFLFSFTVGNAFAQSDKKEEKMESCCMMQNGKMMVMDDGVMKPMDHNMVMKNGTTCTPDGQCIKKNGKKVKMKEGKCMHMDGKMSKCSMGMDDEKSEMNATTYTCPMHPEVTADKPGTCPKCHMDLVKKQ